MPFAAKQIDWRKMPQEIREAFLASLQQRATSVPDERLTAVELAQRCGVEPDAWQKDLLLSADKQIILNCSRQSGKSTVTALLALHTALFTPSALVLVLAPSQRQSMETFRKIHDFYNLLAGVPALTQESSLKLELANGSRVQVLPGKESNIRGFSGASLLICDEAARIEDALYMAIRPMLSVSRGRIILLSTPFGGRGFFHSEWTEGGSDWKRVRVSASECPRIDPEWLKKERERIGSWWFDQEYDCKFVDSVDQVFSSEDIVRAFSSEVEPLW